MWNSLKCNFVTDDINLTFYNNMNTILWSNVLKLVFIQINLCCVYCGIGKAYFFQRIKWLHQLKLAIDGKHMKLIKKNGFIVVTVNISLVSRQKCYSLTGKFLLTYYYQQIFAPFEFLIGEKNWKTVNGIYLIYIFFLIKITMLWEDGIMNLPERW